MPLMALPRGLPELGDAEAALLDPADCSDWDGVFCTAERLPEEPDGIARPDGMVLAGRDVPIALARGLLELGVGEAALLDPADCSDWDGVDCSAEFRPIGAYFGRLPAEGGKVAPIPFERGLLELGVAERALFDPADCSDCDGVAWTAELCAKAGTAARLTPTKPTARPLARWFRAWEDMVISLNK